MKTVLVLGAGRSSSSLISYLLNEAKNYQWMIWVGDVSEEVAQSKLGNSTHGKALAFDIHNQALSQSIIKDTDVVVSLLPPHLHIVVAGLCLQFQKHLLTASYVSPEMKALDSEASQKEVMLINECGLDPGIDHMSAMQVIDRIKSEGGVLTSFKSFTGGLIAPETQPENLWRYKFTWNPRNVVMAGQSVAKFLEDGYYKYIPYQQLFKRTTQVDVKGYGMFEGYANRDSLSYIDTYNLQGIETMLRGTLRHQGFCDAWDILVQLGCCDDTYFMQGIASMTHADFVDSFLQNNLFKTVAEKLAHQFDIDIAGNEMQRLRWSGFFDETLIGLEKGTPAEIVEHILNKKWKLHSGDKDMIVMHHQFVYELNGACKEIQASLVVKGDDSINTAMAKTVGLPLAITAKLVLQGKINQRGVLIPILPEIYNPVLTELKQFGINLNEQEISR